MRAGACNTHTTSETGANEADETVQAAAVAAKKCMMVLPSPYEMCVDLNSYYFCVLLYNILLCRPSKSTVQYLKVSHPIRHSHKIQNIHSRMEWSLMRFMTSYSHMCNYDDKFKT